MEINWIYLDVYEGEDSDDYDDNISVKVINPNTVFYYDLDNMGLEVFGDSLKNLNSGYYKVEYSVGIESEYSEGYKMFDYSFVEEIKKVSSSPIMGRLQNIKYCLLPNFLDLITCPFRKCWQVEWYYGSVGTGSNGNYLPKAIYHYFLTNCGWGEKYTGKVLRYHNIFLLHKGEF